MSGRVIDIGQFVDEKKVGAFHIQIIAMCFLVLLIDGFNISIASFAGPGLVQQFNVSNSTLGALFSAGLIAGLVGTPLFGALADRFGRKRLIILGVLFFGIFTLAAVVATSFQQMIVLRFIAGIGVAGVLPTTVALASEFAPRRFRATMVTVMFTGTTLGGVVTGVVAAKFVGAFGWQILFWIAGVGPIVLTFFLIFLLPESIHYLAAHQRLRPELVKVARRLDPGIEIDDKTILAVTRHESKDQNNTLALFTGRLAILTPLLWVANLLSMVVFYFVSSWLPTILAASPIGASGAAIATSLYMLGGAIGGLAIMRPLDRFGFSPIAVLFLCGIPTLIAIGTNGLSATVLLSIIIMAGFCIYGLQFGLIAMEGLMYAPPVRGRGLGFCFAAARVGASIGPLVGGILIGQNLDTQTLFIVFSMPLAAGGIVAAIITPLYRKQVNEVAHNPMPLPTSNVRAAVAAR